MKIVARAAKYERVDRFSPGKSFWANSTRGQRSGVSANSIYRRARRAVGTAFSWSLVIVGSFIASIATATAISSDVTLPMTIVMALRSVNRRLSSAARAGVLGDQAVGVEAMQNAADFDTRALGITTLLFKMHGGLESDPQVGSGETSQRVRAVHKRVKQMQLLASQRVERPWRSGHRLSVCAVSSNRVQRPWQWDR